MSPEEIAELVMETLHVLYDVRDELRGIGWNICGGVESDLDELIDRFEELQE